jgi:peptide deformylase
MSSKNDIISLPNNHLRSKSSKIHFVSEEIKEIIEQMKSATLDWEDSREHEVGVALAAVQIDKLFRVVIIRNDFENKKDRSFTAFINPEIVKLEGEIEEDYEGCLSIRDIYGKVPRHTKVRIKAIDEHGEEFRIRAEGFLARVFQHEVDHMNGTVFIDHIKSSPQAFFRLDEAGKLQPLDYENDVKDNADLWE